MLNENQTTRGPSLRAIGEKCFSLVWLHISPVFFFLLESGFESEERETDKEMLHECFYDGVLQAAGKSTGTSCSSVRVCA